MLRDGQYNFPDILDAVDQVLKGDTGYMKVPPANLPPELHEAADWLGPQYGGGREKLYQAARWKDYQNRTDAGPYKNFLDLMQSPDLNRILPELPPGIRFLGGGAEALAFEAPDGRVIRVSPNMVTLPGPGINRIMESPQRPRIPEMLEPVRSIQAGDWRVEHMPKVKPVSDMVDRVDATPGGEGGRAERSANATAETLADAIRTRGYDPWDVFARNVGMTNEGNAIIYDGGAVDVPGRLDRKPNFKPEFYPTNPKAPTPEQMAQLQQLGGADQIRDAIQAGLDMGTKDQGMFSSDLLSLLQQADPRMHKAVLKARPQEVAQRAASSDRGFVGNLLHALRGSAPYLLAGGLGATYRNQ